MVFTPDTPLSMKQYKPIREICHAFIQGKTNIQLKEVRGVDKLSHTILSTNLFIWNIKEETEIILKFDITSNHQSLLLLLLLLLLFFFFCGFCRIPCFGEQHSKKITKQINQHLTLLHADLLTFPLKICYKFLIPLMEIYNFTLPAFLIHFL